MTPLEAHGMFAVAASEGRVSRWPVELRIARTGPLEMTALAVVSGWLPDADAETEVVDAALHGLTLADIGVAYRAAYERAVEDVLAALHDSVSVTCN